MFRGIDFTEFAVADCEGVKHVTNFPSRDREIQSCLHRLHALSLTILEDIYILCYQTDLDPRLPPSSMYVEKGLW